MMQMNSNKTREISNQQNIYLTSLRAMKVGSSPPFIIRPNQYRAALSSEPIAKVFSDKKFWNLETYKKSRLKVKLIPL